MANPLELHDVTRTLAGEEVLRGLTLSLAPGECRALVGMNGAGKTTALRIALGMLRPSSGTVRLFGEPLPVRNRRLWGQVGHLVETPFSYPELSARQNILASGALHGAPADRLEAEKTKLARMICEEVGRCLRECEAAGIADALRLTDWLDVPVRRLSLGTRQKVGLAAALVHQPALLILDEPTIGLDPIAIVGLRELIGAAVRRGAGVLVTSHHFDEVARIADRVDILHRGRIIDAFPPSGNDVERRFFTTILNANEEAPHDHDRA